MATRASFISAPYSGYHHRDVPKEDETLTRVGPGTPCGEYMRRFWQPVAYAHELTDLPLRIRILGEDLVVFRDQSGQVGLLELHCSHRGTSLEFGIIGEKGIRCCYHGWLFNVDGTILETPGEPEDSTLKDRLCHGAYPTHEYAGMVFAYMGPPDERPAFPMYDSFELPGWCLKTHPRHSFDCNWLQVKDNAVDTVHLSFLHQIPGNVGFNDDTLAVVPELDWVETPVGMVSVDMRRVGDNVWLRMNDFMPPNVHQFPTPVEDGRQAHQASYPMATRWTVPNDDTHTTIFSFGHVPNSEADKPLKLAFGQTSDRSYEERQRVPGDNDAQSSIHWGLARHGLEHLTATDRGVIMLRELVRKGIKAVQDGKDPRAFAGNPEDLLPTFASHVVVEVPPAATSEADMQLLFDTRQRVIEKYITIDGGRRVQIE